MGGGVSFSLNTSHLPENGGGQHQEPTATGSHAAGLGDRAGTFQCAQPPHFVNLTQARFRDCQRTRPEEARVPERSSQSVSPEGPKRANAGSQPGGPDRDAASAYPRTSTFSCPPN